ncbi:hypothetical protein [Kitasatospora phosalacinea]|uniref:Uncharacterized protein n=1 Tax=Kitasatospora phosalacinea TaxID=2065 RepID=A0ABW6GIC0_9ACTN
MNARTHAGYLEAEDGHLFTFFFDVNDDVDRIAVILQQEACAEHRSGHRA